MLKVTPLLSRRVASNKLVVHPWSCLGSFKPSIISLCRPNLRHASSCAGGISRTPHLDTRTVSLDKRLSTILQFIRTSVRNATHQDRFRFGQGDSGWGGRPPGWDPLDSNVVFYGIIALNVGIFFAWQSAVSSYRVMGDPTLLMFLRDNFLVDMRNIAAGRFWTLFTACFSHRDASHALFNGMTFYFLAPAVMKLLGTKRFLTLYFLGGISSSLVSLAWNNFVRHENISSHGASGAIMATLALYACAFPRNTFLIFFVIPCPAWAFLPGILIYDGWRSISDRRSMTDSAGHVGGLLSGIGYYLWRFTLRR